MLVDTNPCMPKFLIVVFLMMLMVYMLIKKKPTLVYESKFFILC
jgi:hypothetical protein